MKKVLIIANLIHAFPRMSALALHLSEFGWEPAVLTVPLPEDWKRRVGFPADFTERVKVIETPYPGDIFRFWRKAFGGRLRSAGREESGRRKSLFGRLFIFYQSLFGYPDDEKSWKKPAVRAGRELLRKEKFDAIVSSSSPVTSHLIAGELKKKRQIPWLADFRDLWSRNHNYQYGPIRKLADRRLELKTLSSADAITVVSSADAGKMKEAHGKKPVYVVTNGFDPKEANHPPAPLTPGFTVTYTGQIYAGKQDPLKFLKGLKAFISESGVEASDIEVRFYGPGGAGLEKEIENIGLSGIVRQYGMVSRQDSLRRQRESQVLLLLNWEDPEAKGVYTGKVFEYLAAGRPILAAGGFGSDAVEQLLKETGAGRYASSPEEIKDFLAKAYSEYKSGGRARYEGSREEIKKYSHRGMAEKFVGILRQIALNYR